MQRVPPPRLRFIRPFATHVFNRLSRRVAGWLPGFAILTNVGRKTGKTYRTPVNVFRQDDTYVFALTYGSDVHWVRNIVAAGWCVMRTRGRDVRLVEPEVFVDPECRAVPPVVRVFLRLDRVSEFLRMTPEPPASGAGRNPGESEAPAKSSTPAPTIQTGGRSKTHRLVRCLIPSPRSRA